MPKDQRKTIQKEHVMWFGVIVFSLVIISLWGYALFYLVKNTDLKKTQESQMLKNTKEDWNKIFEETKIEEKRKQSTEQIKTIINALVGQSVLNNNTTTINSITTTTATTTKL